MDLASLWLSGIAIVVSVGTAISQVILWKLSGPNLKVKVSTAMLVGEFARSAVVVTVTNDGRAPTRLRRWQLIGVNSYAFATPVKGTSGGPELPRDIGVGEELFFWFDLTTLREELLSGDQTAETWLRAEVLYGSKKARSTDKVRVSHNPGRKGTLLEKLKSKFRPGIYVASKIDPSAPLTTPFREIVYSTGWFPIRNVRLSVVTGLDSPPMAGLEKFTRTRRLVITRIPWSFPIPEELLALADNNELWWKVEWQGIRRRHGGQRFQIQGQEQMQKLAQGLKVARERAAAADGSK